MKQLKSVLKNIDIFGNIIGFKYENEDRIKSIFGGCLTICLLIIAVIYIIISIHEWGANDFNLSVKTSTFAKNLTYPDNFNSSFFGFRFGVLERHNDGLPTTLGELNPIGVSNIDNIRIASEPYLHEIQTTIGNIINCYKEEENTFITGLSKFEDKSFRDSFKNLLCSNISKQTNISIGSDFDTSKQIDYIETNLYFDVCQITKSCRDPNTLSSVVKKDFRVLFSLDNQFFDKSAYDGYKTTTTTYSYHRLDFSKDLDIDVVVSKNVVFTDPNKLFNILPTYSTEFYSYQVDIRETTRVQQLENGANVMTVKFVFRQSDREVFINREFKRIEDMTSDIATIIFAIYFVFKLILFFFKRGNLTLSLLNKIYKFKEEDNDNIDFEAFQSVMEIGSILDQQSKLDKEDKQDKRKSNKVIKVDKQNKEEPKFEKNSKSEIDNSLSNLNQQNESQQDNPLRIEFKVKGDLDLERKEIEKENAKEKDKNINVGSDSVCGSSINKANTKRDAFDSNKGMLQMIQMPSIICSKDQPSNLDISNLNGNETRILPGLVYLEKLDKDVKYLKKLDIPKLKLFFFICFGPCYRKNNLSANYYYIGKEFLNYDLNIETFLKKAIEYESFKKLVLTEKHRRMLVNYQRRKITKDNFVETLNEMRNLTQFSAARNLDRSNI